MKEVKALKIHYSNDTMLRITGEVYSCPVAEAEASYELGNVWFFGDEPVPIA